MKLVYVGGTAKGRGRVAGGVSVSPVPDVRDNEIVIYSFAQDTAPVLVGVSVEQSGYRDDSNLR